MSHIKKLAVYLRSPIPEETERRQNSVLGRAESLRQQGLIEEVTVTYWHRLATASDQREVGEIEAMEQWAAKHNCTLAPTFDRHDRHSAYTGDDSVVTLPVLCLAAWDNSGLVGVYPHVGPSGHCTVADGLDRVESALRCGELFVHTGSQR